MRCVCTARWRSSDRGSGLVLLNSTAAPVGDPPSQPPRPIIRLTGRRYPHARRVGIVIRTRDWTAQQVVVWLAASQVGSDRAALIGAAPHAGTHRSRPRSDSARAGIVVVCNAHVVLLTPGRLSAGSVCWFVRKQRDWGSPSRSICGSSVVRDRDCRSVRSEQPRDQKGARR
jgi:hypothetical protein